MRIRENSPADGSVSEEGGAGGVPGAERDPRQPM